ncbi:MAG: ABC transporter permease [Candidatus Izimaplasma sp.]|nr:ABC transporter permease [Candidatus Izimaplasma bacterium]
MNVLYQLVIRNLRLYLRDKAAVFFSFLSVILIILLYVLFLGVMQIDNLANSFGDIAGIDWLVSSWIMAGLLTVSSVTVPLTAIGRLIQDRESGMIMDFYTSPINRRLLALSYLISSWIIGLIMVSFNFIIGQIYVVINGGELLGFTATLQILGVVLLSIITFSSFFFYIALFMKTRNAFGILSTLVGTLVGFFGGIYIPIGVLGKNIQSVMNVLPTAHSVTIMRNVYMKEAIDLVFTGAPQEAFDTYSYIYGLEVHIGSFEMGNIHLILAMGAFALVFYILSVLKLSNSKL